MPFLNHFLTALGFGMYHQKKKIKKNQSTTVSGKESNIWKASHGGGVGVGLILIWNKLHFPARGRACISSSSTAEDSSLLNHFLAFCWLQQSFLSPRSQVRASSLYQEGKNLKYKLFCWKTLLKLSKPQLRPCWE